MIHAARAGAVAAAANSKRSGAFNGTTGYTDFSEYGPTGPSALDTAPANWTFRPQAKDPNAELRVEIIKGRSVSGQMMIVDTNSDGFAGSFKFIETWDIPGELGTSVEIVGVFVGSQPQRMGVGQLESGSPSGGLYTAQVGAGAIVDNAWFNGRIFTAAKPAAGTSWNSGSSANSGRGFIPVRWLLRMRRDGNRIRAKFWGPGTSEPGSWDLDITGDVSATAHGLVGLVFAQLTNPAGSPVQRCEYLGVSADPASTPAPLPLSDAQTGGNFGVVDFAIATVGAGGFLNRPLTNPSGAYSAAIVARGGSKHGNVLQISASSGTAFKGFLSWTPAGNVSDGDVLALIEMGGALVGCGLGYARPANGSGYYDISQRTFALVHEGANNVYWCPAKPVDTSPETNWNGVLFASLGAVAVGEKWWIRHRRNNEVVQIRAWKDGTSEPGSWNIDNSASGLNYDIVGLPAIGYEFGGVSDVYIEHLAWTDDPTANPINPV